MSVFDDQKTFMRAMGNTVEGFNKEQVTLYLHLTAEEFCETLCAANPNMAPAIQRLFKELRPMVKCADNCDQLEMFDGAQDVLVTTIGFGISAGFPMQAGWDEVLRSNMAKVGPNGEVTRNEMGKVLKPEGWTPPDLKAVLDAQHDDDDIL